MRWWWWALGAGGAYLLFRGGQAVVQTVHNYQVQQFAKAISIAEGTSYADGSPNPNSLGMRNNNPGDIEDSFGVLVSYPTLTDGWNALYDQCSRMLNGTSTVYQPGMTLMQTAMLYTGNDNPVGWAETVAQHLGLSINNTLEDVGNLTA